MGKIYGFRLRFSLKPIHGYFPFLRPISAAEAPFVPREGSCCAAHGGRVSQTSTVHADNHGRLAKIGENGAEKLGKPMGPQHGAENLGNQWDSHGIWLDDQMRLWWRIFSPFQHSDSVGRLAVVDGVADATDVWLSASCRWWYTGVYGCRAARAIHLFNGVTKLGGGYIRLANMSLMSFDVSLRHFNYCKQFHL